MANRRVKSTKVLFKKGSLDGYRGEALAIGLFKDTAGVPAEYRALDEKTGGLLAKLVRLGDFIGLANESVVLYAAGTKLACKRILVIGLGNRDKFDFNVLRQAAGSAGRKADSLGVGSLALALHSQLTGEMDAESLAKVITEGVVAGRYDYREFISQPDEQTKTAGHMDITIIESKSTAALKMNKGRKVGLAIGRAQNRSRMVADKPANEISPLSLGRHARRLAGEFGLRCKIFDSRQLQRMKMNAILAVGAGSANKPCLIALEYRGRSGTNRKLDAAVVGKAITFDSGGLSLKPSAGMEMMKFDKCGGCSVLGILTGVAELKLKRNILGLIPAAENMPSHTSYRPGDIIRTHSGKTVEVQNTDAEGRLILADALSYAAAAKPAAIIDMATLTGACVVALGEHHAGLFGNNTDLLDQLKTAAESAGEPVWHMPSGDDYLEQLKSKVADLRNIGGREAGSCTAAAFLGEFAGDVPWAHIDIAGVAYTDKGRPYRSVGATGFSVRLVLEYLRL